MDFQHGRGEQALLLKWEGENVVFNFGQRFCYFRHNKNVLETREAKQVDSQLQFAPKIIKFCLVVFENELIEDVMPVPKSPKTENPCFTHV